MKDGHASFSAEVVAVMRAIESQLPEDERVCYDPYAKFLIRPLFRKLVQSRLLSKLGRNYIENRGPGFQACMAARTRYIDDIAMNEVAAGAKQVVILGAGLDARAFRLAQLRSVRVFEVDFPATQTYKLERLRHVPDLLNEHVTYVPIDFNRESLQDVLLKAGYSPAVRTLFIWEGVTMYLDATAVDSTLAFMRQNKAKGSTVFFDYFLQSVMDGRCQRPESLALRRHSTFLGSGKETYTFGIEDGTVYNFLNERGFGLLEEMDGESLKKRYFKGANKDRYVFRLCGFVHAAVDNRANG